MNENEDAAGRVLYCTLGEQDAQRIKDAGGQATPFDPAGIKGFSGSLSDNAPEVKLIVFVLDPYEKETDAIIKTAQEEFICGAAPYFWDRAELFADEESTRVFVGLINEYPTSRQRGALEENTRDFFAKKEKAEGLKTGKLPVADFLDLFLENRRKVCAGIRTGYRKVDIALNGGFRNELYILTAGTGTGKSALAAAIAQNIAQQGVNVLYYCLEMGRDEFIARGVSMISKELEKKTGRAAVPFSAILGEHYNERTGAFEIIPPSQYVAALNEYRERYGQRLYFKQGGIEGTYARKIAEEVKEFKRESKAARLVCIVDYLQLLDPDPEDKTQRDKTSAMSAAVRTLKALASQDGCTVIALSSKSNAQKNQESDAYSTKYSGDIGYTAGVVLGWEWKGVTDTQDSTANKSAEERADALDYREMLFRVNKNRNGKHRSEVAANYYPAYNYFEFEDENGFLPAVVTPFDK